jgi:hypothetical protein
MRSAAEFAEYRSFCSQAATSHLVRVPELCGVIHRPGGDDCALLIEAQAHDLRCVATQRVEEFARHRVPHLMTVQGQGFGCPICPGKRGRTLVLLAKRLLLQSSANSGQGLLWRRQGRWTHRHTETQTHRYTGTQVHRRVPRSQAWALPRPQAHTGAQAGACCYAQDSGGVLSRPIHSGRLTLQVLSKEPVMILSPKGLLNAMA